MKYTTLGETGMEVSRICLGCMSFGSTDWREWVLEREKAMEILDHAIDLGVNFFDTANVYSHGESERILGEAIAGHREKAVVGTKVRFPTREGPNASGLSRKVIEQSIMESLERLGVETIDLYQVHRSDRHTPMEQTLRALDDTVRRGHVRHIGASSMWAHQFAEAIHIADREGTERFATMQNLYNLAYREEEREMLPLCEKKNIGVIPWSPLARGFLTRPHEELETTDRGQADQFMEDHPYETGGGKEINERVEELANEKDVKMAQVALAWLLHKDWVTAPIVGTTSLQHLEEAVEAIDISLSDSDIEYLEESYEPVPVTGLYEWLTD